MSAPKDSLSKHLFFARLKPFGRPMFWLPLGILSLSMIGYWQYQQNPDWLGTILEQPQLSLDGNETETLDPNATQLTAPVNSPATVSGLGQQADPTAVLSINNPNQTNNQTTPTRTTSTLFAPLTGNNNASNSNKSSLFIPLMPQVKQNSNPSTQNSSNLQPIQGTPTDRSYPLQKALENLPSSNANYGNRYNTSPNPNTGGNSVPTTGNQTVPRNNNYYPVNPSATNYQPNNTYTSPTSVPTYQAPTYGTQPSPTGYPNQVPGPTANSNNPYQVPTQSQTNPGYTIQPPINARSSGY